MRHLQYHEREVKKKVDAKKTFDQIEYFLRRPRRTVGAIIAPCPPASTAISNAESAV